MSGVPRGDWAALKPCGTASAYRRHFRHGEKPCESCRQAEARRRQDSPSAHRSAELRRERYRQARAAGATRLEALAARDRRAA